MMHEHDQVISISGDNNPGVGKILQHQDFRYPAYSPGLMNWAGLPFQSDGNSRHPFYIGMEDEEQPFTPLRKRKSSYSHGGKQSRRFQGSLIQQRQTLDHSRLFDGNCMSSSNDGMDLKPSINLPSAEPTQAIDQLSLDSGPYSYHIAEEPEVSDTTTNISGRSTPISSVCAPSSIATCSSTGAIRTNPSSPKQSLSYDFASEFEGYSNFRVHCDLLGFMNRHYGEDTSLHTFGSVISLSGTADRAQATTAEQYINQHWKWTGPMLLEALQSAINRKDHTCQVSKPGVHLCVDLDTPKETRVRVRACQKWVDEISYQLEWIGCAFQFSDSGEVQYSTVIKDSSYPSVMRFQLQPISEESASCWFPLFANSVIARGFLTTHRTNDERGLEMPFEVMAALAGVQYLIQYEGDTILKGFSYMLVPIGNYHDSIQWHFVSASEYDRPWSGKTRVSISNAEMWKKRAFLGWCERAEICLGTRGIDYNKIDYTPTREYVSRIRISEFQVTVQPPGISLAATFQIGARDHSIYRVRGYSLPEVIQQAENTPIVLYDLSEKRGWLVPASGVILHVLHTQHVKKDEQPTDLDYANPSQNGLAAASIALRESTAASNEREQAVFKLWDTLCSLPGATLGSRIAVSKVNTFFRGAVEIRGWEYMDMVEQNQEIRHKWVTVQESSGGWVKLARDIKCPVVIAIGLSDIIKPTSGSPYCQSWTKLPTDKDYLGASAGVLQGLYNRAGSGADYRSLTTRPSRLHWHSPEGSNLFGGCESPCRCKPLQRLVERPCLGTISHPTRLEINGAVIFGYIKRTLQRTHGRPREIEVSHQDDITTPDEAISPPSTAFFEIFDETSEPESLNTPMSPGYLPSGVNPLSVVKPNASKEIAPPIPPVRNMTGDTLKNTPPVHEFEVPDRPVPPERNLTGDTLIGTLSNDRPMPPERNPSEDILEQTPSPECPMVTSRPPSPASRYRGGIMLS